MLLKKYRSLNKKRWIRTYIKGDMCEVCNRNDQNCIDSENLKICTKMNADGELFNWRYKYGYVIKKI